LGAACPDEYAAYLKRAETETFGFEDEVCVLDVETTGFSPEHDRIIEVGIVRMRGVEVVDEF